MGECMLKFRGGMFKKCWNGEQKGVITCVVIGFLGVKTVRPPLGGRDGFLNEGDRAGLNVMSV